MKRSVIIGIDLGGTNLKVALLGLKYKIIDKQVLSTRNFRSKEDLMLAMVGSVQGIFDRNSLLLDNVSGIGIGVPGPVDVHKGVVHFLPNIPGWENVKLKNILSKKLKLPVFVDNDAKLMALAEYNLGAARGNNNALCLTLGTGVGGGLIINGRLFRGANNAAGEFGHVPLNEFGRSCNCGGSGCLEAYIGNNVIQRNAKRIFRRDISLEELSELANIGDKRAQGIWLGIGEHLGIALVGAVNFLNLDIIVIGGGVANAGRILFDKIRETIKRRAMSVQAEHVKVVKASLGSDAGLIGAAVLVAEARLNEDIY